MQWNLIFKNHHAVRAPHQHIAAVKRRRERGRKRLVLKWLVRRSEEEFLQSQRRRAGFLSTPSRKESFTSSAKRWNSNCSGRILGRGFQGSTLLPCNNYVITTITSVTAGLSCASRLSNSGCCCRHTQTHTHADNELSADVVDVVVGDECDCSALPFIVTGLITRLASASNVKRWSRGGGPSPELTALIHFSSAVIMGTATLMHTDHRDNRSRLTHSSLCHF